MSDDKNIRPSYYNRGGIEARDVIRAWGLDFDTASAVKYIARAGHKPDEQTGDLLDGRIKDLTKARTYIDLVLKDYLEEQAKRDAHGPGNSTPQKPIIKAPDPQPSAPEPPAPPAPRPQPQPSVRFVAATAEGIDSWVCSQCAQVKTVKERYRAEPDDGRRLCSGCTSQLRQKAAAVGL